MRHPLIGERPTQRQEVRSCVGTEQRHLLFTAVPRAKDWQFTQQREAIVGDHRPGSKISQLRLAGERTNGAISRRCSTEIYLTQLIAAGQMRRALVCDRCPPQADDLQRRQSAQDFEPAVADAASAQVQPSQPR